MKKKNVKSLLLLGGLGLGAVLLLGSGTAQEQPQVSSGGTSYTSFIPEGYGGGVGIPAAQQGYPSITFGGVVMPENVFDTLPPENGDGSGGGGGGGTSAKKQSVAPSAYAVWLSQAKPATTKKEAAQNFITGATIAAQALPVTTREQAAQNFLKSVGWK